MHLRDLEGANEWIDYGCRDPACMDCWKQKALRTRGKIKEHLDYNSVGQTLWMLTYSTRDVPSLPDAYSELTHAERRLRQTHYNSISKGNPTVWGQIENYVGVFENKRDSGDEWNVHSHKIITTAHDPTVPDFIDFRSLQNLWKKSANDPSAHLDIADGRPIVHEYNPRYANLAVNYLAPYLTKSKGIWGGMSVQDAEDNKSFLRGKRFLRRTRGTAPPRLEGTLKPCCVVEEEGMCLKEFVQPWPSMPDLEAMQKRIAYFHATDPKK